MNRDMNSKKDPFRKFVDFADKVSRSRISKLDKLTRLRGGYDSLCGELGLEPPLKYRRRQRELSRKWRQQVERATRPASD